MLQAAYLGVEFDVVAVSRVLAPTDVASRGSWQSRPIPCLHVIIIFGVCITVDQMRGLVQI